MAPPPDPSSQPISTQSTSSRDFPRRAGRQNESGSDAGYSQGLTLGRASYLATSPPHMTETSMPRLAPLPLRSPAVTNTPPRVRPSSTNLFGPNAAISTFASNAERRASDRDLRGQSEEQEERSRASERSNRRRDRSQAEVSRRRSS